MDGKARGGLPRSTESCSRTSIAAFGETTLLLLPNMRLEGVLRVRLLGVTLWKLIGDSAPNKGRCSTFLTTWNWSRYL